MATDLLLACSGVPDRAVSTATGEAVRGSTRAGVWDLFGRGLLVGGVARTVVGFGDTAGLGEAGRPLVVAGEAVRCLARGLVLERTGQDLKILEYHESCKQAAMEWRADLTDPSGTKLRNQYQRQHRREQV